MEHNDSFLILPLGVISRVDIGRLLREVELLTGFLQQAAIRQPGTSIKLPKTSRMLDEIIQVNQLNVLIEADCARLKSFLESVKKQAPVMHMSFSADPSPLFSQRLVEYLRKEIHPLVLVQVGLQPNIGAGCVVRTTNHYFDFSLRQRFTNNRELLAMKLKGEA